MSNSFVYQSVFGGANIYPSDVSYSAITLAGNITLNWPLESGPAQDNFAAKIMDVQSTVANAAITLPDATGAGVGETILFNNVGVNAFMVTNGVLVASIPPAQSVQVYLADNSTSAGVWRSIPFGVGVSPAQAASLAGYGLTPDSITARLDTAIEVYNFQSNLTLTVANRAQLLNWYGVAGTVTLPDAGTAANNWYCIFRNTGSSLGQGQLTIAPQGITTIDNVANKVLKPGESCYVICDGKNFYTVGYGQNAVFVFDFDAIPLPAGTTTYTLSGSDLNRIAYGFSGGPFNSDVTVIVPFAKQQYWVYNGTTGTGNFYVKTNGQTGTGAQVVQGQRTILYCDGSNVFKANDNNVPTPIPVAQGGTGAITASGALTNLGATTIGRNVFTATTQAAAQNAIGIVDQTTLTIGLVIALGG